MLGFIHIAKTGGQTVQSMLSSAFGPAHTEAIHWRAPVATVGAGQRFVVPKYSPDDFRRLLRLCPWTRSVSGHPVALWSGLHEVVPDVRYFCLVRDPVRRGASHYQFQVRTEAPDLSWREWIAWPVHHNHQVKMLARKGTAAEAIAAIRRHNVFVGLTERFDESLVLLRKLVAPGINIAYRRTNTASSNEIARALLEDPAARADMERVYAEDRILYEFVRDELYPEYVRRYGPGLEEDVAAFRAARERRFNRRNVRIHDAVRKLYVLPAARLISRQR